MARAQDLVGLGTPAPLASLQGYTYAAITGAGTTGATGTAVLKVQTFIELTATGSDGIRLPSDADLMVPYIVINSSGSTGKVYPHTGGNINGGSTDAGISLTTLKGAILYRMTATRWVSLSGA